MNAKTYFVPTLNATTELDPAFIRGFVFVSSISGQLPLGYFDYFDSKRIQVLGRNETGFLQELEKQIAD